VSPQPTSYIDGEAPQEDILMFVLRQSKDKKEEICALQRREQGLENQDPFQKEKEKKSSKQD